MLTSLSIRDVVLIDHLDLEFGSGLGVLTGETGAGKSILLDSLGLASGARAESNQSMSTASAQSLAQSATGLRGSSRNTPSASVSQGSGSAQASNSTTAVSGSSGSSPSFSPSVSCIRPHRSCPTSEK